jgi:TRAP-type C4-dicarboxylate transport system permease small subunit
MEIVLDKLSKRNRAVLNTLTRILCTLLFVIIGYNLFLIGNEFHTSGEVSSTLKLPFFPIAYFVGVCCFIECFVFLFDIVRIWKGQYE